MLDSKQIEERGTKLLHEEYSIFDDNWEDFLQFMEDNFYKKRKHTFHLVSEGRSPYVESLSLKVNPEVSARGKVSYILSIGISFRSGWVNAGLVEATIYRTVKDVKEIRSKKFIEFCRPMLCKQIREYFFPKF